MEEDTDDQMRALVGDLREYLTRSIKEEAKNAENGIESANRVVEALQFTRKFLMERYEERSRRTG